MPKYSIENMSQDEVNIAIEWAQKEGWNPGLNDALCFYQTDPNGFFAGKINNQIIAIGSAVKYDEHFGFCGFYIVDKKYRNQGYGLQLTKARLAYLEDRIVGLDGLPNMLDKYARIGYKFAHDSGRYACKNATFALMPDPDIVALESVPFELISQYDRNFFPAPRPQFLSCWIKQNNALALGYYQERQLKGYGVIRKCFTGYKIGPLFADSLLVAKKLFEHLQKNTQNEIVFLDVPENNHFAIDLVRHYGMSKISATARMYRNGVPKISSEGIYGITTLELG